VGKHEHSERKVLKVSIERKKSLTVYGAILALVALAAIVLIVEPRWAGADITSGGTTQPVMNTNILQGAYVSYTNTQVIAPIPSNVVAYRRTVTVLTGCLDISPTNIVPGNLGTLNITTAGSLTPYYQIYSNQTVELTRSPYGDSSVVVGVANAGSTTPCIYTYQITGLVVSNQGGSIPSGAAGAANIAVAQ
jgi:hypothetical protein